jgi:hypothetical protein
MATPIPDLMERAVAALDLLARTAEPIENEEQYVRDLVTVWSARLRAVGEARSGQAPHDLLDTAFERLADEAGLIADPHRAIDWLSTLPQVALLAVGEESW